MECCEFGFISSPKLDLFEKFKNVRIHIRKREPLIYSKKCLWRGWAGTLASPEHQLDMLGDLYPDPALTVQGEDGQGL
jgi:hypothetical protein